jgi:DNA-binding MarR family transcriptional regulator
MSNSKTPQDSFDEGGDGLASFLTYRLHLLNKTTDAQTEAQYEQELGITLGMARCVAALGFFGSLSVNALGARSNLDKSQASRVADALVQREYVFKAPSTSDLRGVELTLTRSGAALYKKIIRIATQRNTEVFACLSKKERELFGAMLTRLLNHARETGDHQQ